MSAAARSAHTSTTAPCWQSACRAELVHTAHAFGLIRTPQAPQLKLRLRFKAALQQLCHSAQKGVHLKRLYDPTILLH